MVFPADLDRKVPAVEVGGEASDEIVGHGVERTGEGHGFPSAGVATEAEAEFAVSEGREPGDEVLGCAVVRFDQQMDAVSAHGHVGVVAAGTDEFLQPSRARPSFESTIVWFRKRLTLPPLRRCQLATGSP